MAPVLYPLTNTLIMHLRAPFLNAERPWTNDALPLVPEQDRAAYAQALEREAVSEAAAYAVWRVPAVWVSGGGLVGNGLAGLLAVLRDAYALCDADGLAAEVTVEVDPDAICADLLDNLAAGGVNRIAIDLLTASVLEARELGCARALGTMGVLQALMAERGIETAVRLLAGIPGQTERSGVESVEAVLALGACEVDIQPFLLDPDTPLAHERLRHDDGWRQQPVHRLPTTVERAAIAAAMGACLAREGCTEYLPGVWALAGYESRYRRLRSTGCAVLGCGLGARTRVHGVVSVNTCDLATYLEAANDPERRVVERYAVPE